MAMILQMYEVQMLFVAVELAKKKKIITNSESKVVLAHDGLMLLKSSFKENYTICLMYFPQQLLYDIFHTSTSSKS